MSNLALVITARPLIRGIAELKADRKPASVSAVFRSVEGINPWDNHPSPPWKPLASTDCTPLAFATGTLVAYTSPDCPFEIITLVSVPPGITQGSRFIRARDGERGFLFPVPDNYDPQSRRSLVLSPENYTVVHHGSEFFIVPTSDRSVSTLFLPSSSGPYHVGEHGLPTGPQEPQCYDCVSFSPPATSTVAFVSLRVGELKNRPGGTLFVGMRIDSLSPELLVVESV